METLNGNNTKKGTFWSLVTLCSQGGISGKGLSKKHNVLVTSFAGGTSKKNKI